MTPEERAKLRELAERFISEPQSQPDPLGFDWQWTDKTLKEMGNSVLTLLDALDQAEAERDDARHNVDVIDRWREELRDAFLAERNRREQAEAEKEWLEMSLREERERE